MRPYSLDLTEREPESTPPNSSSLSTSPYKSFTMQELNTMLRSLKSMKGIFYISSLSFQKHD